MFKALPESLTIKPSGIHDLGVFADQDIKQATNLGVTHLKFNGTIFRTPLGGFINHSNTPNCEKVSLLMTNHDNPDLKFDYKKCNLITLEDIIKGEEIT